MPDCAALGRADSPDLLGPGDSGTEDELAGQEHDPENSSTPALIRDRLALPGVPSILMQLGRARTTHVTARRPPADLTEP